MRKHLKRVGASLSVGEEQPVLKCANTGKAAGFRIQRYLPGSARTGHSMSLVISETDGVRLQPGVNTLLNDYFSQHMYKDQAPNHAMSVQAPRA